MLNFATLQFGDTPKFPSERLTSTHPGSARGALLNPNFVQALHSLNHILYHTNCISCSVRTITFTEKTKIRITRCNFRYRRRHFLNKCKSARFASLGVRNQASQVLDQAPETERVILIHCLRRKHVREVDHAHFDRN